MASGFAYGSSLTNPYGINDAGQIVGYFNDANGTHGFLATPGGSVVGDPHFTTFDGLNYDFQGLGDFVLARSAIDGDPFDIQIRTRLRGDGGAATVISALAAELCSHRASFDTDRADDGDSLVWIDGRPSSLSIGNPILLGDCEIAETSRSIRAVWDTGEMLDVRDVTNAFGSHLNLSAWYSPLLGPASVEGLLISSDNPEQWRLATMRLRRSTRSALLTAAVAPSRARHPHPSRPRPHRPLASSAAAKPQT